MWLKVKSSRTGVGQLFTVSSRGMAARRTLRGTWARAIEKEGREMCECEQTMPVTGIRVNFTVRLRIMVHLKIRFCLDIFGLLEEHKNGYNFPNVVDCFPVSVGYLPRERIDYKMIVICIHKIGALMLILV